MSKHTSEPWVVWHDGDVVGGDQEVVCNIPAGPARAANAHLIAAVLELLETLKAVGSTPWGYCFCPPSMGDMKDKPDDDHCGECREARLAIRAAEGK